MGYFKPATLSFTAPRDFFDNTGKNAPLTKITIELPREFKDYATATGDPPYDKMPIEPQVLADIQAAVLRQYGGVARQFLGAFRQGAGLSDLAVTGRTAALGDGVGMQYSQQFGREIVGIYVSAEAARKLVGKQDSLLMLVLYGDNKLAYVPMSSIASPAGKVSKKTLASSSWMPPSWWDAGVTGSFYIVAAQLKFSTEIHAVEAAFSVSSGGVVSIPTNETQFYVFNSKQTLLSNAASSIVNEPYPKALYPYPVINRNGNNIYNERGDTFQINGSTISRVADGSVYIDNFGRSFGFRNVMAVSTAGERHTGALTYGIGFNTDGVIDGEPISQSQESAYESFKNTNTLYPATSNLVLASFGPNPSTINATAGETSASISTSHQIYSKLNGVDVLTTTSGTINATFERFGIGAFPSNRRMDGSLFGYNFYSIWDTDTPIARDETIYRHGFPYALAATKGKMYVENWTLNGVSAPFFSTNFYTPYGEFGPYVSDDTPYVPSIFGWLHVSDGKNLLQAFVINDGNTCTKRMYLNNADYGSKLASAIGCSVDDIRLILFDIKKADVDKLK